ncbi:MAG: hypothetical protein APR62_13715 [Smithella sp. SDB]|nr:MAG: hypothetical protein APR62_13715 [Smithella sp. SDB]
MIINISIKIELIGKFYLSQNIIRIYKYNEKIRFKISVTYHRALNLSNSYHEFDQTAIMN